MYKFYGALLQPLAQASMPKTRFNAQLTEFVSDLLTYRPNDQELDACLAICNIIDDATTRPGNAHYVNYKSISMQEPRLQSIEDINSMIKKIQTACAADEWPNVHDLNELCKNLAIGWIHRLRSRRIVAARLYEMLNVMETAYLRCSQVQVLVGRWRIALLQIANWSTSDYDPEYDADMGRLVLAIEAIADPGVETQFLQAGATPGDQCLRVPPYPQLCIPVESGHISTQEETGERKND